MSSLTALWNLPSCSPTTIFHPTDYARLPSPAAEYLRHAIADGTPLYQCVRLQMIGQIKLKGWIPFTATQVIRVDAGFVWEARAKMGLATISGSDQFLDGRGRMRWKLFGLVPVMTAAGPDISRSAEDRFTIEQMLLPSAFCEPNTRWKATATGCNVNLQDRAEMELSLRPSGQLSSISMERWGNPDGGAYALYPFGGFIDEEATWSGYTIPSRLRVGWHFGTERFGEGEFFRVQITSAEFR